MLIIPVNFMIIDHETKDINKSVKSTVLVMMEVSSIVLVACYDPNKQV